MDKFQIVGPYRLAGRVRASGAKNAALPLLAASAADRRARSTSKNVPRLRDIAHHAAAARPLGSRAARARTARTV